MRSRRQTKVPVSDGVSYRYAHSFPTFHTGWAIGPLMTATEHPASVAATMSSIVAYRSHRALIQGAASGVFMGTSALLSPARRAPPPSPRGVLATSPSPPRTLPESLHLT